MSEQSTTLKRGWQSRTVSLVATRRDKMFGLAEIIGLGLACLVLFLVLLSYLYFLLPARSRLATLQADQVQLKSNISKSQSIVSKDRDTKQTVERITSSLDKFEHVGLVNSVAGRTELYDELNQLIVKNGLRNTSGPAYTALEPAGTKTTPGRSASAKWQTYYPGIAVDVTVEGPYQNLRHFIRDIEASKQLLIINQVELQRATNNGSANLEAPAAGNARSLVSLQLNMTTYFQRIDSNAGASQE